MRRFGLVLVSSLVLAACGAAGSSGDSPTTSTVPPTSSTGPTPTTQPGDMTGTDVLILAAVDDLLGRVEADRDDIEVVAVESGTWNDGSLGCPEEGMSYTQVLVEGYRIKLMLNGTVFVYSQGGDEPIFYCEQPNEDGFRIDSTLPEPSIPPPID